MLRSDGPDEPVPVTQPVTVGRLARVPVVRSRGPRCGIAWALWITYHFSWLAFLPAPLIAHSRSAPWKTARKTVQDCLSKPIDPNV